MHNNSNCTMDQSLQFAEACKLMREKALKFSSYDSSSSEDELDETAIVEKVFSKYSNDDVEILTQTREYLCNSITSGAVVCLVCIDSIKRNEQVWSCQHCYGILHLHCIQKWARESTYFTEGARKWCCPKCRSEYDVLPESLKYLCFCSKVENPAFDPWRLPHSCGKCCEKRLKPDCSHVCALLCHPGPCPPCPQMVLVSCCCCKSKPVLRRCSNKEWVCSQLCMKELSCQSHQCSIPCHLGPCPPCKKQSKKACLCRRKTSIQPCENFVWQCNEVCSKPLSCGNHICQITCHKGDCPSCPNSGSRSCPCSKNLVSLSCTETVQPCGDTCDKLLDCGMHRCPQRCHFGPCGKCLQVRDVKCRCGQKVKSMPCCKDFLCDTKCKRRRNCGKHSCNKRCCIGSCPPCEAVCGKSLNCNRHKCQCICHPGPCYPCSEEVTIPCFCGHTKIKVPCGKTKKVVPPRCSIDCKIQPNCHHPQRQRHRCHFGPCPPCKLICGKTLSCGHTCPYACHSALVAKKKVKKHKIGPWDLDEIDFIEEPCPSCKEIVSVPCLGGHGLLKFSCPEARVSSCGRPCGRQLLCGNHTCQLECHKCNAGTEDNLQSEECQPCEEMCSKPRGPGCAHPCLKPCHPGYCNACQQSIKLSCHCGISALYVICSVWFSASDSEKKNLLSCKNRCPKLMACGHRCTFLCHPGDCDSSEKCKKKITLRCSCKLKKREIQCHLQSQVETLQCDDQCFQHKEKLEFSCSESDQKRIEEEKKRQEEEMAEFLRKTEGKKRKKKKNVQHEARPQRNYNTLYMIVFVTCLIALLLYIILYNA